MQTKSRIGYLPEESYLYRYLNSRETLDFFGNLFHLGKGERDNRAEQLLEMVGLSKTHTRAVGEFSKGMQRRIGLAQALINDPDLVILDEPTSGLDPIGCREVKDLILALARRGKTVILSSHLLSDVEDVCDRVVIYYGGKIQAMGTLKDLLATPDTLRITTPVLPRETLERVLEIIRKDVAGEVRVDKPTQNLESYFLDVVQKARRAAAETSGATSGARVAAYLRAGVEERPPAEKILEDWRCRRLPSRLSRPNRRRRCRRAESGRQKTGSADKSRRINAVGRTNRRPQRKKSRWICRRRMRNCRRCWVNRNNDFKSEFRIPDVERSPNTEIRNRRELAGCWWMELACSGFGILSDFEFGFRSVHVAIDCFDFSCNEFSPSPG